MPAKKGGVFDHNRLYDWIAPVYDLGVWTLASLAGGEEAVRRRLLSDSGIKAGMRVLEPFAGTASLSLMAAREGAKVTALDKSAGMLSIAREKAGKSGGGIGIVRGDASQLPFSDETFDLVLISMGLHEVGRDTALESLSEAYRVLKDGCRLAVMDYHRAAGLAWAAERFFLVFFEGDTARDWIRMDIQRELSLLGFRDFRRKFALKGAVQLITALKRS